MSEQFKPIQDWYPGMPCKTDGGHKAKIERIEMAEAVIIMDDTGERAYTWRSMIFQAD